MGVFNRKFLGDSLQILYAAHAMSYGDEELNKLTLGLILISPL